MDETLSDVEKINLSFDAHFNLVSIHPFYGGNGRTSRLFMNYIQAWYNLPLAIVRSGSKAEYIAALITAREKGDITFFRRFLETEYAYLLKAEITKFKKIVDLGDLMGLSFYFKILLFVD